MNNKKIIDEFVSIVGNDNVLTDSNKTKYFRSGFRSGCGKAIAIVFPNSLVEQWRVIQACVNNNCIIIMQAAKTGLTEGSAPSGNDYDRDVVVINVTRINQVQLLDGGRQALCFPGTSLYSLEKKLKSVNRAPHSVIGSSTIGATVIGGVANNSGGALVKRGPAYTELAIYGQVDKHGKLHLVNHLGIDGLGDTPEEILRNLELGNFDSTQIQYDERMASDKEYDQRVRDVTSEIPSRFNADERRLFEASGCAGKIGVFAVRVDSYPVPEKEQVFYVGTNDPSQLTKLRRDILTNFENLPEMAEYMHRDIFNIAEKYGKDVFLSIDLLGTDRLPKMFALKAKVENIFDRVPFVSKYLPDAVMYYASKLFPQHLPERMLDFRDKYEHHLVLKMSEAGIREAQIYLREVWGEKRDCDFFECTPEEGKKAYLHRFAAAGAAIRYETIHRKDVEDIVALDIALRRNDEEWLENLPEEISKNLIHSLYYGHFMCHVFHQDYIFKKGTDTKLMKKLMLKHLNARGAKYPAEHNVGHLYEADNSLQKFYHELDPTNTFNPGIGKMEKYKRNCSCCV
ncbi:D-lactate dehydrogenase [Vibrio parahaemolyticus]|uniref:D-lactate dehydrogenase n=1 Tax=Vibrio parahaemolyticus TaxID=670 RepID=UPI0011220D41|nr:D-lactate dehydrogenase [Vibrio parahaemolyticus]MBE4296953.1 D-lactate dehydrogenase [Vibrio parahaemolyticus]MBE4301448.1 D-lactate dehydrogenase [Vibrio parahaemolyticus]MDF4725751.1 D-lactate dehydrogenase [Vibrio parahaemolyticus]MDF4952616.1 D-lactate dehydrogenase [Vibrio parahaemolyticus]MDF4999396.1 D-lactate dehydrogenase [Vibrio parahaemolyticus]